MAGQAAGPDPLHRAGQSVGERLQRELQRQTERRVLERRDLLHTARGNGTRRAVEAAVQYRPTPSCPRRTTPRPRDDKTIALVPQDAPTPGTTDGSGSNIGSGTATGGTSERVPAWAWPSPDGWRGEGRRSKREKCRTGRNCLYASCSHRTSGSQRGRRAAQDQRLTRRTRSPGSRCDEVHCTSSRALSAVGQYISAPHLKDDLMKLKVPGGVNRSPSRNRQVDRTGSSVTGKHVVA